MGYLMLGVGSDNADEMSSRLTSILEPGEPEILIKEKRSEFRCFSILDLFKDLFWGSADERPLLSNMCISKNRKEVLGFLLPQAVLRRIESWKDTEGELYIKFQGNNNDYKGFVELSVNNNKIISLLHKIFTETDRLKFIEDVRSHIVCNLLSSGIAGNDDLVNYLSKVGNSIIVPCRYSSEANIAFLSLLESRDQASLSVVIANFFISSLLGLRSMKYKIGGKTYKKTYLLSSLGMEYIWKPDLITTSYEKLQKILQTYRKGDYRTAYRHITKWIAENESASRSSELALAYQIIGTCLLSHPDDCELSIPQMSGDKLREQKREAGANYLEQAISSGVTEPEPHYSLYEYYISSDSEKASFHLTKAFMENHAKAIIECVSLSLRDPNSLTIVTDAQMYHKLTHVIEHSQNYSSNEVSRCLYLRGMLGKQSGNIQATEADFVQAAKRGHERARQELSRKERMELQSFPSFSDDPKAPCCFVNSLNGNNLVFISTLPDGEWSLFTPWQQNPSDINAKHVKDIDEFIRGQCLGDFDLQPAKIVLLFMSTDEDRNLNECLILLDKLFNIALRIPDEQKNALIDCIDIYVGAKYEMASMLIDANINDMGNDIYFKVHIADETRDAVHRLLCDAPLFIPFLNRPRCDDAIHVVLFGCSETNYCFIKESIGCAFLGQEYPINITMLGPDADHMERRLRQECPGLFHEPRIECIKPKFISCCIEEEDFPGLIYGSDYDNHPDDKLRDTLRLGNYFVVDLSNDRESIRFAMGLRTWLLRSRGTFDRTPFIGVKCTDSQNSYLAVHLTLSGQAAGSTYYSRYDLFPFGISRELYSFHRLIEKPRLEEVALQIHKSYYEGNDGQAENDYYSFSYNVDSSLLTAIGLSYRLFAGGAFFHQKDDYLEFGAFDSATLLSSYVEAIKIKEEYAAALEQSRWNGFMLSRGWESADVSQVRAYKDQSTGTLHKHTLAKLHPFIREWADIDSDDLLKILGMLQSKFDYGKLPKSTTRKSVQDTPKFLSKIGKSDGKTH